MQKLVSIILLIILFPILLIAILAIYLTMGSPAFFTQQRIGKNKNPFTIYKLRTMKDQRITLLGKIYRKTGIDEIPQLLNILKGQMSFVGPRPLTEEDIQRLEWTSEEHDKRWMVSPGITGLAQLTNVCDKNVSWRNDMKYIENKSILLDFRILLNSMLIPFLGKKYTIQLINKTGE